MMTTISKRVSGLRVLTAYVLIIGFYAKNSEGAQPTASVPWASGGSEAQPISPSKPAVAEVPWQFSSKTQSEPLYALFDRKYLDEKYLGSHASQIASNKAEPGKSVLVQSKFEEGIARSIEKIDESHWVIDFQNKATSWFCVRVDNASGKAIRIDLKNVAVDKWRTLNPVYSYQNNISDPPMIEIPHAGAKGINAKNGPLIPNVEKQSWQFIPNVWREGSSICFEFPVTQNRVFVAMRYPYTPSMNLAFIESLREQYKDNDILSIDYPSAGYEKSSWPLPVVTIHSPDYKQHKDKPTFVMYAREHSDEQDSSWVATGAISFLLSESEEAKRARDNCNFIIIPILDMEGAATSKHNSIIESFGASNTNQDARSYASFFKKWVDDGYSLDIVLNLHNFESAEWPYHFLLRNYYPEQKDSIIAFDATLQKFGAKEGYRVQSSQPGSGDYTDRLGVWLRNSYGTAHLLYEINVQEQHEHLSLYGAQGIGVCMVRSAANFLMSKEGKTLRDRTAATRQNRVKLIQKSTINPAFDGNAIEWENELKNTDNRIPQGAGK